MEYDRRQFGRIAVAGVAGLLVAGWPGLNLADSTITYVVRRGDSLWAVASRFGVKVSDIKTANRLTSDTVIVGQSLKIPGLARTLLWRIAHRKVDRRRWNRIIVHHSATTQGGAASFDRHHRLKCGMKNGLAYHFVIGNGTSTKDGEIEVGNRWKTQIQGGHVRSEKLNKTSIGICLVGNFEVQRPTKLQMKALGDLTFYLKEKLLGGRPEVVGHRDVQDTLCPGKNFPLYHYRSRFG